MKLQARGVVNYIQCVLVLATAAASSAWARPPLTSEQASGADCVALLSQAREARRQHELKQAQRLFEQALSRSPSASDAAAGPNKTDQACHVAAGAGLAEIYNRSNASKQAIAAARTALAEGREDNDSAEAAYQLGHALLARSGFHRDPDGEAEAALHQAILWSQGHHRNAIRELALLYAETDRSDDLEALQQRYPAARVQTMRRRLAEAPTKPAAKPQAQRAAAANASSGDGPPLPRFEIWGGSSWFRAAEGFGPPIPEATATIGDVAPAGFASDAKGEVVLSAQLGKDGTLSNGRVLTSLDPQVDPLALQALARWRFSPATDAAGEVVDCTIVVILHFQDDPK